MAASRNCFDRDRSKNLTTDETPMTPIGEKIVEKDKIPNGQQIQNLPKSFECDESANIKSHSLDMKDAGRLTFLINSSLKLGTF